MPSGPEERERGAAAKGVSCLTSDALVLHRCCWLPSQLCSTQSGVEWSGGTVVMLACPVDSEIFSKTHLTAHRVSIDHADHHTPTTHLLPPRQRC